MTPSKPIADEALPPQAPFELAFRHTGWTFQSDGVGGYHNHYTEQAWIAWQGGYKFARAALAAAAGRVEQPALQRFNERMQGIEEAPLERLRFFCSLAMNGQDWLDVEPFFDALEATPPPQPQAAELHCVCGATWENSGKGFELVATTPQPAQAEPKEGLAHLSFKLVSHSGYEQESEFRNITPEQFGEVVRVLHGGDIAQAAPVGELTDENDNHG